MDLAPRCLTVAPWVDRAPVTMFPRFDHARFDLPLCTPPAPPASVCSVGGARAGESTRALSFVLCLVERVRARGARAGAWVRAYLPFGEVVVGGEGEGGLMQH